MKKVISVLSVTLFITIFFSCSNKDQKKPFKEKNLPKIDVPFYTILMNNEKERTRLWKLAIDSGDFNAYNKLATPYLIADRDVIQLYYYSLIMANKYHCPEAYYNLCTILEHPVSTREMEVLSNDKDTKNLALYYLFKAKELGFKQAKFDVEVKFGKGKSVPNSSFFLKQLR